MEPAEDKKPIALLVVLLIIAAIAGLAAWGYSEYSASKRRSATDEAISRGLNKLAYNDTAAARAEFQNAMDNAQSQDERGYFETLLASTYEEENLMTAAGLYLSVADNLSYSPKTRGLAGTYLALALGTKKDFTVAKYVFSAGPWHGFYKDTSGDDTLDLEIALARAHEWSIAQYPNFLSYFVAGEFYARKFTYYTEEQRLKAAPRIVAFYSEGQASLEAAVSDPAWSTLNVMRGYLMRAQYAVQIERLLRSGQFTPPSSFTMSQNEVREAFADALDYATKNSLTHETVHRAELASQVYLAEYLLSLETVDTEEVKELGENILTFISANPDLSKQVLKQLAQGSSSSSVAVKKSMVTMARDHVPALQAKLVSTGVFSVGNFSRD